MAQAPPYTVYASCEDVEGITLRRRGRLGLARIGVMTITDREFQRCQSMLGTTDLQSRSFFARASEHDELREIVLCKSPQRSNAPALRETLRLVEAYRPEFILLVGTCGGIRDENGDGREGSRLGDVVVPDVVHYNEMMKVSPGVVKLRHLPYDQPSHRLHAEYITGLRFDDSWQKRITVDPPINDAPPRVHVGGIAVGEKIYGDGANEMQRTFIDAVDKVVGVEMESYGVASAVYSLRHLSYAPQYLTIRAISDFANGTEADATRDDWTPYAAETASAFALALAERILQEPEAEDR